MIAQVQKAIELLGYSASEAKVYLAALSMGEAHASDIATKTKLPRTSVQSILETLHREGVVNFYVQRRYKYWVAENPERLLANFRRREEAMLQVLPALSAIRARSRGKRAKPQEGKHPFYVLADSSQQPVLIANEKIEIEYVNAAWEKQFGYMLDEVRGKTPWTIKSGATPLEVYTKMWGALGAGTMFQSDEIIDKRKDGSVFKLRTTIFPLRHNGALFYIQLLEEISGEKRGSGIRI